MNWERDTDVHTGNRHRKRQISDGHAQVMNYRKDSDHNPQKDGKHQDRYRGIKFGLTLGSINPRRGLCFHPLVH